MNIKFTKEHEWIKVEDGAAYIGISDFAQNALSDIVFVELPKVGTKLESGKEFGSVESVKAVSEIFAPVSGTVVEINEDLENAPELLNANAEETWIIKVEPDNAIDLDLFMSKDEYEEFCKNENE